MAKMRQILIIGNNDIFSGDKSIIVGESNITGLNGACDINCAKQVLVIGETNNLKNEVN